MTTQTAPKNNFDSKISTGLVKRNYSKIGQGWLTTALMIPLLNLGLFPTSSVKAQRVENGVYQMAQVDRWSSQVRRQLIKVAFAAGFGGYSMTHDPFVGSLDHRNYQDVTFNLKSGRSYRIFGVCDGDCRDIDLRLYDENSNLISSDILSDDTPMVTVTPGWNATFTVRASMISCSSSPCRYGLGAFAQ